MGVLFRNYASRNTRKKRANTWLKLFRATASIDRTCLRGFAVRHIHPQPYRFNHPLRFERVTRFIALYVCFCYKNVSAQGCYSQPVWSLCELIARLCAELCSRAIARATHEPLNTIWWLRGCNCVQRGVWNLWVQSTWISDTRNKSQTLEYIWCVRTCSHNGAL